MYSTQQPEINRFVELTIYSRACTLQTFVKEALIILFTHCESFGISLRNGVYRGANRVLFNQWRAFTGAHPSELWLLNSYLLDHIDVARTMALLKRFMEKTTVGDRYTVAEIPQWRDGWKRALRIVTLSLGLML